MISFEILISLLAFITVMLFSLGVFFTIGYQKERWKISKRIKQISGGLRSEEFTDVFYRIKGQLV